MSEQSAEQVFVGIDVAQDWLEVAVRPGRPGWRVRNTPDGVADLAEQLRVLQPTLVVLEGTGGLERMVLGALGAAGVPAAAVNPRQARDVARARGKLAKTDRIDAAALAHFADAIRPAPRPLSEEQVEALRDLVSRRRQLVDLRAGEHNRLGRASALARTSVVEHIVWLDERIAALDRRIADLVQRSPLWRRKEALLRSVPGVGPGLAAALLVDLPELGRIGHKAVVALLGVAPHSRDSGKWRGHRKVAGGRARARTVLSMATVTATRWNPDIRQLYRRLLAAGKLKKVALVACRRQLLITLNAVLRDERPWDDRSPALAAA